MSLTFDLTGINEDVRLAPSAEGGKRMHPVTETLIMSTMIVGIGHISEKTVDEFAARIELYQNVHGALMQKWNADGLLEPLRITRENVEAHLTLRTNVAYETRNKWVTRMVTKNRDVFKAVEPK